MSSGGRYYDNEQPTREHAPFTPIRQVQGGGGGGGDPRSPGGNPRSPGGASQYSWSGSHNPSSPGYMEMAYHPTAAPTGQVEHWRDDKVSRAVERQLAHEQSFSSNGRHASGASLVVPHPTATADPEAARRRALIEEKRQEVEMLQRERDRMLQRKQQQRDREASAAAQPVSIEMVSSPAVRSDGSLTWSDQKTRKAAALNEFDGLEEDVHREELSEAYSKQIYNIDDESAPDQLVGIVNSANVVTRPRFKSQEEKERWKKEINSRYRVVGNKPIRIPKSRKNPYSSIMNDIDEDKDNKLAKILHRDIYMDNYDRMITRRNFTLLILAVSAMLLNIIQLETVFEMEQDNHSWTWREKRMYVSEPIKAIISLLSIISTCIVVEYWRLMMVVESRRYGLRVPAMWEMPYRFPNLFFYMVVEMLIYLVGPIPFLILTIEDSSMVGNEKRWCIETSCKTANLEDSHIVPFASGKWSLLIFLRIYVILRCMRDMSSVYRTRKHVVEEIKNNNPAGTQTLPHDDFTWLFTLKYLISEMPMAIVPAMAFGGMVVFSYCIHVCERSTTDGLTNFSFLDSMWFMFITMSTIGYGDRSPTTSEGRAVTILGGSFGLLMGSLLTIVVLEKLAQSAPEKLHSKTLLKMQLERRQEKVSCEFIQVTFRERQLNKLCRKLGDSQYGTKKRKALQYKRGKLLHEMRTIRAMLETVTEKNEQDELAEIEASVETLAEYVHHFAMLTEKQMHYIVKLLVDNNYDDTTMVSNYAAVPHLREKDDKKKKK